MTHRLVGLILGVGTGLLLGGQLVIAADRIDLFEHELDSDRLYHRRS